MAMDIGGYFSALPDLLGMRLQNLLEENAVLLPKASNLDSPFSVVLNLIFSPKTEFKARQKAFTYVHQRRELAVLANQRASTCL